MADDSRASLPTRLLLQAVFNVVLVWLMARYLGQYFSLTGGWTAAIIVGALLTLMNIFLRPVLSILTFPLKLFATILAIIIVNGVFVQLISMIVDKMQPDLVTLEIFGGLWGWIVVAFIFGFANWLFRGLV